MTGELLYAEDDENDVFLMRRALRKIGYDHRLTIVSNGHGIVEELSRAVEGRRSTPALVILDLKMPEMNGLEALQWIREQPALSELPVILFSSSTQPTDIVNAARLGANAYFVKPGAPPMLQELLYRLKNYMESGGSLGGWWPVPENQALPVAT